MTKDNTNFKLFVLILAMSLFIITLFADLIQNYQLSITWYNYYILMKEKFGKEKDDDVKEPEDKNKWGWLLYKGKLWSLVIGYLLIFVYFVSLILLTDNSLTAGY